MGAAALFLSACVTAPPAKYEWGQYEQLMYNYYKKPDSVKELMESMATTIRQAEAQQRSIGPGMYAEYGYLLMLQGKNQDAVDNFEKEKRRWPESAQLMDKMSKMAFAPTAPKTEAKQ
ncbi:MAG: DUF4810 domain-containing protein [Pseudomonadota bacterium]